MATAPSASQAADTVVAVDTNNETDSAFGDDLESETTSLSTSVTNYRFENGRRYHGYKDGEYWGPNDDAQNDQLDILHHTYLLLFDGKLYQAPIGPNPQKVLDVGTGTGIWAIDFADEHPSSTVIGTDLSPTQPRWVPPNCKFEIDDATAEWTFAENSFDLIYVRGLFGSIRDWDAFYKQAYKHLKPGGWYEQTEASVYLLSDDNTIPPSHIFKRWSDIFVETGEKMGKTFQILDRSRQHALDAGFVNVEEKRFKMPVGGWPRDPKLKDVGRWHLLDCYQGIEGWALALLTRVMGWSVEDVQLFLAEMRLGLKDRKVHGYTSVSIVYGQKPLEDKN